MTRRKPMTEAKRVRIFDRHKGVCYLCDLPINYLHEAWHCEHVKPLWLGGADDESNLRPAHRDCHASKTTGEAVVRAKSNRVRARHIGAHKPRQVMPGSKASKFKKRMDGTVEIRRARP